MNQNLTRYYSRAFWHENPGEEVFSGLQPRIPVWNPVKITEIQKLENVII
jgi:hypothetical protein